MYMSTRHQSNSTRLFGLIGTAVVIAAAGGLLVSMRETVSAPLAPPPTVFLAQDEPPIVEPSPVDLKPADPTIAIPLDTVVFEPIDITWDTEAPPAGPPVDYGSSPTPGTGLGPSSTPAAPTIPATRPALIPGAKPDYPLPSIRARESGSTTLSLCISKSGRVTQASVAASSGSKTLDNAALAWIRHERFKPATQDGQPVDICNHALAYVWELPKR